MKSKAKFFRSVALSCMLVSVIIAFNSCKKEIGPTPTPPTPEKPKPVVEIRPGLFKVSFVGLRSDGGFSYKIGYEIEGGDSNEDPQISKLRLFENGVELHPPHSYHIDIRDFGKGRFSHWGTTLYFSTSDNTDPVTNGKEYAYTLDGSAYPAATN